MASQHVVYPFFGSEHPFSNWYSSNFIVDDKQFINGEQWMMYAKAQLFNDIDIANKIMFSNSPRQIKILGRKVKNFDEEVWNNNKKALVKKGLKEKFKQNNNLKEILIATDNSIIAEASQYDKVWGIGIGINHKNINIPSKWKGSNLLGIILTELREELKYNN